MGALQLASLILGVLSIILGIATIAIRFRERRAERLLLESSCDWSGEPEYIGVVDLESNTPSA